MKKVKEPVTQPQGLYLSQPINSYYQKPVNLFPLLMTMTSLFAILLFLIFLFLSSLHFYWGLGGRWGSEAVIPAGDNNTKVMMPGPLPTFVVAFGLLGFAVFILIKSGLLNINLPWWLEKYGLWIIAGIFILRAIGEFKYVGFFKKIKQTKFAQNDTKYYSPLCLLIGTLTIFIELSN